MEHEVNKISKKAFNIAIVLTIIASVAFFFSAISGIKTLDLMENNTGGEGFALIALIPIYFITATICAVINITNLFITIRNLIKQNKTLAMIIFLALNSIYLIFNIIVILLIVF